MELESWEQPARGLREYLRQVAEACGSGEVFSVRLERPLTGYVPLEKRLGELDVALVWDERTGWRSVLEPPPNDLITLSYLDGPVCASPEEVSRFAADPGAGSTVPAARAEADVLESLSEYAVVRLHPLHEVS